MTVDTVFDLASLTKVVAHDYGGDAACGKKRPKSGVNDPVGEKSHSGIRAEREGRYHCTWAADAIILDWSRTLISLTPWSGPGHCLQHGFWPEKPVNSSRITVRRTVTSISLALVRWSSVYQKSSWTNTVRSNIFTPLKMPATASFHRRLGAEDCPTETTSRTGMLRGVVHDPSARRMGGVAGQAGSVFHRGRPSKVARALIAGSSVCHRAPD